MSIPPSHCLISHEQWEQYYPRTNYEKKNNEAKSYTLHYLLACNQSDEVIISYIKKLDKENSPILTAIDLAHHKWTPLIIAVIRGREKVVESLLRTKAKEQLNLPDEFKWTPLHHAALVSAQLCQYLFRLNANPTALNNFMGNPQDIYNLTHSHTFFQPTNAFLEDEHSFSPITDISRCRLKQLFDLDEWIDAPYYPPKSWNQLWKSLPENYNNDYFTQTYCDFVKKPPKLLIKKEPALQKLLGKSFGLFAGETILPGKAITEYTGEYVIHKADKGYSFIEAQERKKKFSYYLNPYDAFHKGNGSRMANFGWPNSLLYPVIEKGCERLFLIAGEEIKEKESILWDYGIESTELTFETQCILGEEKMMEFYCEGLNWVLHEYERLEQLAKESRENIPIVMNYAIHKQRMIFPLNCPAALLKLHYSGYVRVSNWDQMIHSSNPIFMNWCKRYPAIQWVVRSFFKRIQELDKVICNTPLEDPVSQWVLENIGNLSIFQILKGMEKIKQKFPPLEKWEKFKKKLENELKSYKPIEDPLEPLSFERRVVDFVNIICSHVEDPLKFVSSQLKKAKSICSKNDEFTKLLTRADEILQSPN